MDLKDIRAEHTEQGNTWSVARSALVMEFYAEGADLVSCGEAILDTCLSACPAELADSLHVFTSRNYKKLTAQAQRRMRKELSELSQQGRFYAVTANKECAVGDFSFELDLGPTNPLINNIVFVALPISAAEPQKVEAAVALFERMLNAAPFWGAIAGLGFDIVWGREFEMSAMPLNFRLARRYHGLLVRDRQQSAYLPKPQPPAAPLMRIPSVAWLTYLGAPLLAQLPDATAMQTELANPAIQMKSIASGLMFRAAQTPPVGDVNRQDGDVAPLRDLDRVLKPILLDRWFLSANLLGVDRDTASEWLHRFEP